MDLLMSPKDPIAPVDEVPFVCGDLIYDNGNFLTYPGRTGRDGSLQNPTMIIGGTYNFSHPISWELSKTLEPHFQTWLFFGLLSEWVGANTWVDTLKLAKTGTLTPASKTLATGELYKKLVYEVDGKKWLTTKDLMGIIDEIFYEHMARKEDEDSHIRRLWNIGLCVQHTQCVLSSSPPDFDWRIRHSIGMLGETLAFSLNALYHHRGLKYNLGGYFSPNYFTPEIETQMTEKGGWCPSDVTRVSSIYRSLHTFNILSKMDRSVSGRDHGACTKMRCQAYQIDPEKYLVGHVDEGCACNLINPSNTAIIEALQNATESFPLLRITGDEDNLNKIDVEIVEASETTQYVAISHVWADGLGNPKENSLHACQLTKLRQLVTDLKTSASPQSDSNGKHGDVLIWLDTFCCPIKPPEAKKLAVGKLHRVYHKATQTLVLDAILRSVSTEGMSVYEIMCRIFTSSWMRRLWTLQESALSKSLWFQFLDRAVSLEESMEWILKDYDDHAEYRRIALDIMNEDRMMRVFLKGSRLDKGGAGIAHLDVALRHRSASVAADEPICIATLMGLDLGSIIKASDPEKMKLVWTLLAEKNGGLPARMIIIHGDCYDDSGWKWAPKSLLAGAGNAIAFNVKTIHWEHPSRGFPTPHGLKVKFPGMLLKMREHSDGLPQHPWREGLNRPEETYLMFRDEQGKWFSISDYHKLDPKTSINWRYTETEMQEWRKRGSHPIHDIIGTGNSALVLVEERNDSWTAILGSVRNNVDRLQDLEGLAVRNEAVCIVSRADEHKSLVWDTIVRTSQMVRQSEVTKKVLEIEDKSSEEYKQAMKVVMNEMKRVMKEALDADEAFLSSLNRSFGTDMEDHMWKYIGEFYNADIVSTALPEDQCWYVD